MSKEYTYYEPMPEHRFIERHLITEMIRELLLEGWFPVGFDDGGDELVPLEISPRRTMPQAVWEAFDAVDEGTLHLRHIRDGSRNWVKLIGGSGEDVISDHGQSLSPILDKVYLR